MRPIHASLRLGVALVLLPASAFGVDIGTLHCNDSDGNNLNLGTTVTVTGIVTMITNTRLGELELRIQDASGGISVFGASEAAYCGSLGDDLTVTGKIGQYRGLVELVDPLSITVNSTGNALPSALLLSPAQVNATFQTDFCEPNEGVLIQVDCCFIRMGDGSTPAAGTTFAYNTVYVLKHAAADSATNSMSMFMDDFPFGCGVGSPLIGQPIPLTPQFVTGVLNQFDGSLPFTAVYEVEPRLLTDLVGECQVMPKRSTTWGQLKTWYR
jgi:hypothetical protein